MNSSNSTNHQLLRRGLRCHGYLEQEFVLLFIHDLQTWTISRLLDFLTLNSKYRIKVKLIYPIPLGSEIGSAFALLGCPTVLSALTFLSKHISNINNIIHGISKHFIPNVENYFIIRVNYEDPNTHLKLIKLITQKLPVSKIKWCITNKIRRAKLVNPRIQRIANNVLSPLNTEFYKHLKYYIFF
ncbi:hypothetical protein BCR32DRAFT_285496 [Anaeromyces robustus]|uniref:Uncharacterized protein n=1 Tax=Anaeromyces robustus TaxID=1754192 RepID=A0A1Y1WNI2_9FUNG|nr:hypothetical protein BCR32DRAFT_285496 [Anaeromyces robustus]|eukprot:ORX75107.1 hypothetical protein BCR32DRAFT_285496 [Anaeromyces robustus]